MWLRAPATIDPDGPPAQAERPLDGLAAINDHRVSDDEGGPVRAQPDDGCGNLLGAFPSGRPVLAITLSPPSGVPPLKRSIIGVLMIPGHRALMRMFELA